MATFPSSDARAFFERAEPGERGRLKVYVGFGAGVGRTYRMLEEAYALLTGGADVVLAAIETGARPESAGLLPGLPMVPPRRLEVEGQSRDEMDLDAVLARRPQVAVVDEIAHLNAPGSRNARRHQDVRELLEAGIHVLCALDLRSLESVRGLLESGATAPRRESVPDSFLSQAEQVVNLDLALEDLLERLRPGKAQTSDTAARVLESFFKPGNAETLRELALRELALSHEQAALEDEEPRRTRAASGRVMVCISSLSPRAETLLRRGARLSGRLRTDWYVVYVETPQEAPGRIEAAAQRHLHANIEQARELGAAVVRLQGRDPVAELLTFARSHAVGEILIGRTRKPWWRRLVGSDFMSRMVRECGQFDLHIVAATSEDSDL